MKKLPDRFDVIIAGAGVSGSFLAQALTTAGLHCLLIEAGRAFDRHTYPRKEVDANSWLYWSGGMELNTQADLVFLRPKCVGGGSVMNQALVDRFDENALASWREATGISFFSGSGMAPWYERAETEISIQEIPPEARNRNAEIFRQGFEANGFRCAPLRRAQKDCRYADGNDCIECLGGCRIDSKQSMGVALLPKAHATRRLTVVSQCEVQTVRESLDQVSVETLTAGGIRRTFSGAKLVMASGAIGNTAILLRSGFADRLPRLGYGFYTHPQYMNLGIYAEPVNAFKKAFQAYKSDDPGFRAAGFKLENVFAPPVGLAMLIPGVGAAHQEKMKKIPHMACVEVAIRDTEPGRVSLAGGKVKIQKRLGEEDRRRRAAGMAAIDKIFRSTGAREVIEGQLGIGLHLMGGCAIGNSPKTSVTRPDFRLHGFKRIYAADSSVFPNAPGINPSLTVMALSLRAAEEIRT